MQIPFLGKQSEPLLGIDIGSSSVKIVELSKSGSELKVQSAGVFPLPPNTIVEGRIDNAEALAATLTRAVQKLRTKAKNVAIAVPGSAVITRVLEMPANLSDDEMESQLLLEAEQYIPYSLDEVSIDFAVLETDVDEDDDEDEENQRRAKVLLVACRKESTDTVLTVMEEADLVAKIIDVEPFCLERVYPLLAEQLEEDSDSLIAVVDCGATNLRVNVLDKGSTVYSREELFGTRQLNEEIQRRYGLSHEEALTAEREGGLPGDYEQEVLVPFRESLIQQISRSLQFFYSSTSYSHVDGIILGGGIIAQSEIVRLTEAKIELPVVAANPFTNMGLGPRVDKKSLKEIAPSLLIATGLALRGVI
jgi:type IV pilus assembly protein PilM